MANTEKTPPLTRPRRGNWRAINWAVLASDYIKKHVTEKEVSPLACSAALIAIARHVALSGEPKATLSYETIAEEALLSPRVAKRAVAKLDEIGLIQIARQQRNTANIYIFRAHVVLADLAATQPQNDAPEADEDTPAQPAEPKPKREAFDWKAHLKKVIESHEPIAGVPIEQAFAAITWNLQREDDDYWHNWEPKSASHLAKNVKRMVEQHREHLAKSAKPAAPKYTPQPAYVPDPPLRTQADLRSRITG